MIVIGLIDSSPRCWNILGMNSFDLTKFAFNTNGNEYTK